MTLESQQVTLPLVTLESLKALAHLQRLWEPQSTSASILVTEGVTKYLVSPLLTVVATKYLYSTSKDTGEPPSTST